MNRSERDNEKLTELLRKLFGAWAKVPNTEELLGYATALRELNMQQVEIAVDRAIAQWQGDFPPAASHVRTMAPSVAALSPDSQQTRDCKDCSGTGYRMVYQGNTRRATLCHCVSAEGQAKYQEWLGKKAS